MSSHDVVIEKIAREMGALQADIKVIHHELHDLRLKQDCLMAQANRWRGGFAVVLGFGALIGWLSDSLLKMLVE